MIIPLFPLGTILFPGGRLPLRIFEQRYMDMAKSCLRDNTPFGICLLAEGSEVAQPGKPAARAHSTGTLASIVDWDMAQLGILNITAQGSQRLRVLRQWTENSGLICAEVALLEDDDASVVPEKHLRLLPLLRAVIEELGDEAHAPAKPHRFHDAAWVSMRFAEILPIPASAKQTLLEVDDSIDRLEIIYRFLESKALLPEDKG